MTTINATVAAAVSMISDSKEKETKELKDCSFV